MGAHEVSQDTQESNTEQGTHLQYNDLHDLKTAEVQIVYFSLGLNFVDQTLLKELQAKQGYSHGTGIRLPDDVL